MQTDAFAILVEPARRNLLDALRNGELSVNDLVRKLRLPQPSVSKHLKVLREAGFVKSRSAAQQRLYRLEPARLQAIDAWLGPYRELWTRHLDKLERHLDRMEE
ncbi:winged helix-turn-helix transcriptional regulator [Nordella sp. HKS 07]|uniref:ArsR/SmtB family transcription factor n=1 Tax=Nordella sp. HKS 07 TaxID=2712222 RepID=UPI0013E13B16|nr:metalloregulator ArsR/SmtB family transcription factor [Nordella sp. HKS 07]QIG48300.1 winged helix-turn-helix transcriptional regulator [Nordella sp. HKS 07]